MKKMELRAIKTPIITPDDRINDVIIKSLQGVKDLEGSIIVIASKIVAITQNRIKKVSSDDDFGKLVISESDGFVEGEEVQLSLKDGIFAPWAGIDKSNIPEGNAVLWPEKPFEVAESIRKTIIHHYKVKKTGIIIADSFCAPLRRGVISVAIAYAGINPVTSFKGIKDLHGNKMKYSGHATADALATAATLLMGETAEQTPIVVIKGAPVAFTNKKADPADAIMSPEECLYSPLYPKSINQN